MTKKLHAILPCLEQYASQWYLHKSDDINIVPSYSRIIPYILFSIGSNLCILSFLFCYSYSYACIFYCFLRVLQYPLFNYLNNFSLFFSLFNPLKICSLSHCERKKEFFKYKKPVSISVSGKIPRFFFTILISFKCI